MDGSNASITFDDEADVVVVGYGSAGAAAAITAADLGARVIIVEKQPRESHTPSSRVAHIIMVVDDVDQAAIYFDRCASGMVPSAVSRAWAERAHEIPDWLDRIAAIRLEYVRGAQHPQFEGAQALRVCLALPRESTITVERRADPFGVPIQAGQPQPVTSDYFDALARAAGSRAGIRVLWESPARRLIQDPDRRVIGVETTAGRIRARRGVVLSCGGYEFDEELKLNYLKAYPVHFYSTPANTGDGVRMAQAAGADLWHMNQMVGRGVGHFTLDGKVVNCILQMNPPGYVITDKHGARFADEYAQAKIIEHTFNWDLMHYDRVRRDYSRIPSYWFFDSRRIDAGPVGLATSAFGYTWSRDNQTEILQGWIKQAPTIAEVAAAAGVIDPAAAARSVDEYNQGCVEKRDSFGRPLDTLVPLDTPPYYCVPLYPGGLNTSGGPRRDEHARILDPFGAPIRGLYGAGELGEPFGIMYPSSGSNLSEALSFGQIAGESAMKDESR